MRENLTSGSFKQSHTALKEGKMKLQENYHCFSFLPLYCFLLSHFSNHLQPSNCAYMSHSSRTLNTLFSVCDFFCLKKTLNLFFALEQFPKLSNWPLNKTGLNYVDPHICTFFSINSINVFSLMIFNVLCCRNIVYNTYNMKNVS